MTQRAEFDKIELHLIRVLHTLITERSVSRAALNLQQHATRRQRPAEAPARADRRPVAGACRQFDGAHRTSLAIGGPGRRVAAARRSAVQHPLRAAPASSRRPAQLTLSHRRQRLPRPAVPAGAGQPAQAAGAAGDDRTAAAERRFRLPAEPGHRRGRPGDRQLAGAARRTAPGPADERRGGLPGCARQPDRPPGRHAAAGRSSATWPANMSRRRPPMRARAA